MTVTLTAPATCAGVVAVIVVLPTTVTLVAGVEPKFTRAPETKPVPLIVTLVPPEVVPLFGVIAVAIGAVFGVAPKNSDMVAAPAPAPGTLDRPRPSANS